MKKVHLILFVFVLLLSACGNETSNEEGDKLADKLNVYNWAYVIPDEVIKGFEEKYNVKVTYDNYYSNEELLAKIQNPSNGYDVIFPSDYMIDIMVKQNLLSELNYEHIPNADNVSDKFKGLFYDLDNKYSLPFQWSTAGIGINTNEVKELPNSWEALFDEKYKGKITVLDDMRYGIVPALLLKGYDVNTTNEDELNEAKKLMIEQKKLLKAYSSDTYIDLLKSGEIWLAYGWGIDILQMERELPSIKYFVPKEGTTKAIESMCIPKTSNRKKTAETFINYILDAKVHADISNYSLAANPNEASMKFIENAVKTNSNVYPDSTELNKFVFLKDVGDATPLYDKVWNEIKNQ